MTKLWFKHAIRDLKSAKALLDMGSDHKYAAAYHAQQCAEKAIKAYLTFLDCRVIKTHDFAKLAEVVAAVDKEFSKFILKHKSLAKLAVIYRYPDAEVKPLTLSKAKTAIKTSEEIYHECYKKTYGETEKS